MSAAKSAKFYESSSEVVKDIPDGAKLLVGGKYVYTVLDLELCKSDLGFFL